MPDDTKRAIHRALVDRVVNGPGKASAAQRTCAFRNEGLSPPLDALIGKVAGRPTRVTDADFAAAVSAGISEDEIFELVVCAAVGQADRLYEAGLRALAEAAAVDGPDHAS